MITYINFNSSNNISFLHTLSEMEELQITQKPEKEEERPNSTLKRLVIPESHF
jgi:hypothetical protein